MMHENNYSEYNNTCVTTGLDNIGWRFSPHKQVILIADETSQNLDENAIFKMVSTHLGHSEWEQWTARLVATALKLAVAEEKMEADISPLFQCDLLAWDSCGEYSKSAARFEQQLEEFLFEVVAENEHEIRVKIMSNN